jgi:hypothetical protein
VLGSLVVVEIPLMGDRYTGGVGENTYYIQWLGTKNFFQIDFDTGHFSQLDLPTSSTTRTTKRFHKPASAF